MADLDPAHVEAVAQLLGGRDCEHEAAMQQRDGFYGDCHHCAAEDILTSTDPDVHAALLAALVRADYLSRARELAEVAAELATASGCSPQDALKVMVQALTEVVSHAHE